jgi:hypothetical protein
MQWSQFSASLRLKLSKSYSLSLSGSFDPYLYERNGNYLVHVNQLRWNHGQFPRFTGTSTSYSYTLNNDTFKKKNKKNSNKSDSNTTGKSDNLPGNDPNSNSTQKNDSGTDKKTSEKDEDGYEKLDVQWSISASYSVRYGQTSEVRKDIPEYKMDFTHNLSLSGNLSLTKNWKFSSSTSYDFKYKQFTSASINITRNLHCWTMTGSVVPFGLYKSYSVHVGVNASMLHDLKYDKRSGYEQNNITWY